MLRVFSALFGVVFLVSSQAFAQIIYEPIQYQYGGQNPYYYGGAHPLMHRYAQGPGNEARTYGRVNGFEFVSANVHTHREVNDDRPRTFSDALGLREAHFYGYTPDDARNDANAAAPRYFRKADVLRDAIRESDGTWTVPAAAPISGGVRIYNVRPARVAPSTQSNGSQYVAPRPLLIIPKDQFEKPMSVPGKVAEAP